MFCPSEKWFRVRHFRVDIAFASWAWHYSTCYMFLYHKKTDEKLEYITRKIKKLRQKSCSRLQQERERGSTKKNVVKVV